MRTLLAFAICFATLLWAAPIDDRNENCEIQYKTVYVTLTAPSANPSSSGSALSSPEQPDDAQDGNSNSDNSISPGTTEGEQDSTSSSSNGSNPGATVNEQDGTSTSSNSSSVGSTGNEQDGGLSSSNSSSPGTSEVVTTNSVNIAGIPIDGHHLSAPENSAEVPPDNRTYTPPNKTISGKAFSAWMAEQAKSSNPPASKFLKVAPGVYNIDCDDNIYFSFMDGLTEKWTVDLRKVTFLVNGACQAIYINQCEDFTIYGGTLWFDAGEIWTQAKITSIEDAGEDHSIVTSVVDDGYNLSSWHDIGPRNLYVMDARDSSHFVRPQDINFWYASEWNFDKLDSERTWTMKISNKEVPLKVGYHLTTQTGLAMGNTIGSENNGKLRIDGFTSNGGLSQYGLGSKGTATFENIYYVNPPPRPGFAQRVEGPTLVYGHVQWFDYNTPGQPAINYKYSHWMTTGCENDLQDAGDQDLHDGGY